MITAVTVRDFKLLRDVTLELGRLDVIVGRNGVGKSSLLEALELLMRLVGDPPADIGERFAGAGAVEHLVSRPRASAFTVEVRTHSGAQVGLCARVPNGAEPFEIWVGDERIELAAMGSLRGFLGRTGTAGLGAALRLELDATALASEHYSEREVPHLDARGWGLASVLQYLHGLRDGTIDAIEADLATVVPEVRRLRTLPARIRRRDQVQVSINGSASVHDQWRELTGVRFELELEGAGWIPAHHLSEGTLLALGLITALRHREAQLLLLDDLDKGLHPTAQQHIVEVIRGALASQPTLQVIATSHSPFVLDALSADEAFVAGRVDPTTTQIVRLDAHPRWREREGFFRPGEFWSTVGEGWVGTLP